MAKTKQGINSLGSTYSTSPDGQSQSGNLFSFVEIKRKSGKQEYRRPGGHEKQQT